MNLKGICRKCKIFSILNIVSINVDAEMISTILVLLNTKVVFDPKSQITMNIMRYIRLLEIPLRFVFPDPVTAINLVATVLAGNRITLDTQENKSLDTYLRM